MPKSTRNARSLWGNSLNPDTRGSANEDPPARDDLRPHLWIGMRRAGLNPSRAELAEMLRQARAASQQATVPEVLPYPPGNFVYYVRLGTRIKIGFTTNLSQRLREVPSEEILGYESGSYKVEQMRHHKFRHRRVSGEWFEDCAEIREHIATVSVA